MASRAHFHLRGAGETARIKFPDREKGFTSKNRIPELGEGKGSSALSDQRLLSPPSSHAPGFSLAVNGEAAHLPV